MVEASYGAYVFSTKILHTILEKPNAVIIILPDSFSFRSLLYDLFRRTYVCVAIGGKGHCRHIRLSPAQRFCQNFRQLCACGDGLWEGGIVAAENTCFIQSATAFDRV